MKIVLDSNIFISDLQFKKISFDLLFKALALPDFSLHIPQLVLDEVGNCYAEKIHQIFHELNRLTDKIPDSSITEELKNKVIGEYINLFDSKLKSINTGIIEYPLIPHQDLIKRAIQKKRPFSEKDKGYRDSLIWFSILELALKDYEDIAFISQDKHFKQSSDDKDFLHKDLIEDLEKNNINAGRISIFDTLDNFVTKIIEPNLELEDVKSKILSGEYPVFESDDIKTQIGNYLSNYGEVPSFETSWGGDHEKVVYGFPNEFETIYLSYAEDVRITDYVSAKKIIPHELLLEIEVIALCNLDILIFKADYEENFREVYHLSCDWNHNDHYICAEGNMNVKFILKILFNTESNEITTCEIKSLSPENAFE